MHDRLRLDFLCAQLDVTPSRDPIHAGCTRAMMKNKLIKSSVAAAVLTAASLTAQAADMRIKAQAMPPAGPKWAGCYLGGALGYAWAPDFDTERDVATGLLTGVSPTDSANANGFKLGGYLGCNWQVTGQWVIGAEGDLEWANARGTTTFPNSGPPLDFYDTRIDNQSSVRGRIGYALDNMLLYVTGGAAFAHVTEHDVLAATGAANNNSATRTGWTLGAGFDYAATAHWLVRLEYRYADFGTFSYNAPVFGLPLVAENHKITENAVRLGLAYKFW
jgi:outer membrane immunogenic protein